MTYSGLQLFKVVKQLFRLPDNGGGIGLCGGFAGNKIFGYFDGNIGVGKSTVLFPIRYGGFSNTKIFGKFFLSDFFVFK